MGSQLLGVKLDEQSSTQLFPLGALHITDTGQHYRYMQADGAVTANLVYTYDDNWEIEDALTTTIAASTETHPLCVSGIALTDNYYAWVFVGPGQVTLTTAAAVAAQAKIYTNATAGKVDDATAASAVEIPGLVAYTAIGSATTGTFIATNGLYVYLV